MKKYIILSWFLLASFAFWGISDSLQKLGISHDEAYHLIYDSFGIGNPQLPASVSKIAAKERVKMVENGFTLIKECTQSEYFATWWTSYRESKRPLPPEPPKPMEMMRGEQMANVQHQITEVEEKMKTVPEDQKAAYKQSLEMLKGSFDQMAKVPHQEDSEMNTYMRREFEQGINDFQKKNSEWEKNYPVDPKSFIKMRLQQYLDLAKTVDFKASLKKDGKVMVFTKAEYEAKDWVWKKCYRAGRDANAAAERIVRAWLTELSSKQ